MLVAFPEPKLNGAGVPAEEALPNPGVGLAKPAPKPELLALPNAALFSPNPPFPN